MRVNVGGQWYDSAAQPIAVELTLEDLAAFARKLRAEAGRDGPSAVVIRQGLNG